MSSDNAFPRASASAEDVAGEQQRIIALARHMRASGRSIRQIAAELRSLGAVNRRGRPLSVSYVFHIVRMTKQGRGSCVPTPPHEFADSETELPFTD